jgi:hypothetical protein
MKGPGIAVLLLVLASTTHVARAQEPAVNAEEIPTRDSLKPRAKRHHVRMAVELGGLAVLGELFYFRGDGRSTARTATRRS